MAEAGREFEIVFRGVRGSYPVPDARMLGYGGNTTCHEVNVAGRRLIFDAGTGIIGLGSELVAEHLKTKQPLLLNLFFTHVHHDHTFGFLYFKPAYFKSTRMGIFGPQCETYGVLHALRTILRDPFHPVRMGEMGMEYSVTELAGGEVIGFRPGEAMGTVMPADQLDDCEVLIRTVANPRHTKLGVMHFRIEYGGRSYVLATDTEGTEEGDDLLVEFAKGADLLAHDAQYTTEEYYEGHPPRKHWGHSTYRMACTTARRAGVKQLAIIHHEPERDDAELDAIAAGLDGEFPNLFFDS